MRIRPGKVEECPNVPSRYNEKMDAFKVVVVGLLAAVVLSLGSALFHLVNDKGDSKKMVHALTLRIGLSIALFILIMIGWKLGLVTPHGVQPQF